MKGEAREISVLGAVTCAVVNQPMAAPLNAMLGSSGPLGASAADLDGCDAGSAIVTTGGLGWKLDLEDGIAYFCVVATSIDSLGTATEEQCFETDTAGTIGTRARITLTAPLGAGRQLVMVARTG